MSDRLPRMNEKYGSPRRMPYASGSDSMIYTGEYQSIPAQRPQPSQSEQMKKVAGMAIGIGSTWAFEFISHPFIVMRRSCQIFYPAQSTHLLPITVVPLMMKLNRNKPPVSMYKGFVSNLLCRGLTMISENVINEFTNWPLHSSSYSSLKKHCLHLLLKWSGFFITTPFYVSSFVETVQSYGANEPPTLLDFLLEGCNRLLGRGVHQAAWIIPMWQLLIPTATFKLCQYCVYTLASYAVLRAKSEKQLENSDNSSPVDSDVSTISLYDQQFPILLATFTGTFLADLVLYPFETVLHRLYIQGTRVLIDNMDTGCEVSGISTQYTGVLDCFRSIIIEEGFLGLYRGFGAFILQFSIYAAGLKIVQYLFEKISKSDYSNSLNGNGHRHMPQRRF
ncbi:mitochondrial outer membrane protein SLC25A46-like [Mercenaria mercenaria]|uniref:mitochondrial outer membrane protein SLC25A46-like n=1 Tax=Mercenaria mercenaria TaxID=6596 RepID=UPI00234F20AF|nr:mitochondrial outer membrane protein SLC25A46-like [Mercenaria mercenaria]